VSQQGSVSVPQQGASYVAMAPASFVAAAPGAGYAMAPVTTRIMSVSGGTPVLTTGTIPFPVAAGVPKQMKISKKKKQKACC